jgi:hypothetical protein
MKHLAGARAKEQKGRTTGSLDAKETILRGHLIPILDSKRLDRISNEDVQRVKNRLQGKHGRRSTTSSRSSTR